ncbi:MAG: hypothetical protein M1830_004074, partial [Pleopsidium flavum]
MATHLDPPAASPAASISTSSLQSQDAKASDTTPTILEESDNHVNGNGIASTPKKPKITNRLTRMFSQGVKTAPREGDASKEPHRDRTVENG